MLHHCCCISVAYVPTNNHGVEEKKESRKAVREAETEEKGREGRGRAGKEVGTVVQVHVYE